MRTHLLVGRGELPVSRTRRARPPGNGTPAWGGYGRRRLGDLAVAVVLAVTALLGCTRQTSVSNGAPPTVVCGTTVNATPAGAGLVDATRHHQVITVPSVRGLLFIKVSDDCAHGALVTWNPAQAATLVKEAPARDGLAAAAVVVRPATPVFAVTARRTGPVVAYVAVHLTSR